MKRKICAFFATLFIWALLNWRPDWEHLLIGLIVGAVVAYFTGDLFVERTRILLEPRRYYYFFCQFLPLFLKEALKANWEVAYRVLHPDVPIRPGIVHVKTTLRSNVALTFLANTLTLASGSLIVDVDEENHILYVHCMDVTDKDGKNTAQATVGRFEKILGRIFDEEVQG